MVARTVSRADRARALPPRSEDRDSDPTVDSRWSPCDDPRGRLEALTPGDHRVSFRGWYVFAPPNLPLSIVDRDESGRPIFPKGVLYTRPLQLEDTITIPE